ncbi:uncharacterized protein BDW70DRAFT_2556 [Aspergillus foveolatus]|uniref:uncharacterized protein n=1 Tax=Aspergillus foveolatus TaxID=210207 RepID=UPI003CCD7433
MDQKAWVYTCNLRHGLYELTCKAGVPELENNTWGERVVDREEFMRPWGVHTASHPAIAYHKRLSEGSRLTRVRILGPLSRKFSAMQRRSSVFRSTQGRD